MTSSQTTTSFSSSATSTTSSVQPSEEISLSTEPAVQPEVSPAQVTEETVRQQAGFLAPAPAAAFYANCAAVRAAGAAPIYAGDPGYSFDLDHDGDGVACEK